MKTLETETDEWKRQHKNLEKEIEDLFNEMTQIILKKDAVITQLQKTNSELEDYVTCLEKLNGVHGEYKEHLFWLPKTKQRL